MAKDDLASGMRKAFARKKLQREGLSPGKAAKPTGPGVGPSGGAGANGGGGFGGSGAPR